MAERRVSIRLSVQDGKVTVRELRDVGEEGQKALAKIERAATPASAGLRFVDQATGILKDDLADLSGTTGRAEGVLAAFGTSGLLAATAVTGVVGAVVGLGRAAVSTARDVAELKDVADSLGVSTQLLQSLQFGALESGIDFGTLNTGLKTFETRVIEASSGTGKLFSDLARTQPELARSVALSNDMEEALRLVSDALSAESDQLERARLAKAAFGTAGFELIPILAEQGEGLKDLEDRARTAGVVFGEDLVAQSVKLRTELDILAARGDALKTRLLLPVIQLLNDIPDITPALNAAAGVGTEQFEIGRLSTEKGRLEKEIDQRRRILDNPRLSNDVFGRPLTDQNQRLNSELAAYEEQISAIDLRIAALIKERDISAENARLRAIQIEEEKQAEKALADQREEDRKKRIEEALKQSRAESSAVTGRDESETDAVRRAQEIERLSSAAARIKAELGDIGPLLQQNERQLQELVDAGLLSIEEKARKLEEIRAKLLGQTPQGRADAEKQEERQRLLKSEELQKETQRQAILSEGRAVYESVRTPAERYGDEIERLAFLLKEGAISQETFTRASERASETLEDAQEAARRKRLEDSQEIVDGVQRGFEDWVRQAGDAASQMENVVGGALDGLEDAFTEFAKTGKLEIKSLVASILEDLARLAIRQTLAQLLGSVGPSIGGIFGPIISGGNAGGGFGGGGGNSSSGVTIPAGTFHTGGIIGGAPSGSRHVDASVFIGAARYHNGGRIGPDEVPIIGLRGERVLNRQETAAYEAGRRYDGPPVQIVINAQDANSVIRSQTQIAAGLARAVQSGRRGL